MWETTGQKADRERELRGERKKGKRKACVRENKKVELIRCELMRGESAERRREKKQPTFSESAERKKEKKQIIFQKKQLTFCHQLLYMSPVYVNIPASAFVHDTS